MAELNPDDPDNPDNYEPLLGDDIEREVFKEQQAEHLAFMREKRDEAHAKAEAEFADRVAAKRRARLRLLD